MTAKIINHSLMWLGLGSWLLVGCTSQPQYRVSPNDSANLTRDQALQVEHKDRVIRINKISQQHGVPNPNLMQLQLPSGNIKDINYNIPVLRIVFDEKLFFDYDKDNIRREAEPVLDVMTENMKRDAPDTQLLILGHTDAIGSEGYNIDLSERRARSVMAALVSRGVPFERLKSVAIGKNQPIAPNSTGEGRARNRRVEFMISARQDANLRLIQSRTIDQGLMKVNRTDVISGAARRVPVLSAEGIPGAAGATAAPAPRAPAPEVIELMPLKPVEQAPLDNDFKL